MRSAAGHQNPGSDSLGPAHGMAILGPQSIPAARAARGPAFPHHNLPSLPRICLVVMTATQHASSVEFDRAQGSEMQGRECGSARERVLAVPLYRMVHAFGHRPSPSAAAALRPPLPPPPPVHAHATLHPASLSTFDVAEMQPRLGTAPCPSVIVCWYYQSSWASQHRPRNPRRHRWHGHQTDRATLVFPKNWMFGPPLPSAQGAVGVATQLWICRKSRKCRLYPAPVDRPRRARRLSAGPIATSLTPSAPPPPSPPLSLSLSHAPGGTPPPSPPAHREGRGKRGAVRCVDGLWRDSDGGPLPRRALPPRSRLRAYPGCALQTRWFITPNIQFLGKTNVALSV